MFSRFWTRPCKGRREPEPHDAHLTWFGRLYFASFRFRRQST